jgi:Na+/H+ antiporter NhaD/arsenite permease-like protein
VVLPASPPEQHRALRAPQSALLAKTVTVAAFMLIGFFAGLEPALVAAVGAAALLVTRRVNPRKIWSRIDWDLLVLFVGSSSWSKGRQRRPRRAVQWLRRSAFTPWGHH